MREARNASELNAIAARGKGKLNPSERRWLAGAYNECLARLKTEVPS